MPPKVPLHECFGTVPEENVLQKRNEAECPASVILEERLTAARAQGHDSRTLRKPCQTCSCAYNSSRKRQKQCPGEIQGKGRLGGNCAYVSEGLSLEEDWKLKVHGLDLQGGAGGASAARKKRDMKEGLQKLKAILKKAENDERPPRSSLSLAR